MGHRIRSQVVLPIACGKASPLEAALHSLVLSYSPSNSEVRAASGVSCVMSRFRTFFAPFKNLGRGIKTICPQPQHLMRMSLPSCRTSHSWLPQGCFFFICTMSPMRNWMNFIVSLLREKFFLIIQGNRSGFKRAEKVGQEALPPSLFGSLRL